MSVDGCQVIHAPAHWRAVDFISDLHLSRQTPLTFDAWSRHMTTTTADAVWILGDLFEVWVGDDAALGVPDSFEDACAQVLQHASQRLSVAFLPGNRDFLVGDALLDACGVRRLSDPSVLQGFGRSVMVSHGDAWCLQDVDYLAFRTQVRSPAWQQAFLAQSLHERHAAARQMREASEARKAGLPDPSLWADVDPEEASRWMRRHGATELVHGHTHRPGSQAWAAGLQRHVLSDWDLEAKVPRAEVLRLTQEGWQRIPPP